MRWRVPAIVLGIAAVVVVVGCTATERDRALDDDGTRVELPTTTSTTLVVAAPGLPPGDDEPVRLIGIDTPETRDPRRPVECFGREATGALAALLPVGTAVRLEPDVERRDRYDRLLAYVWRAGDGLHVNEALVSGGGAAPFRVPPNVKYADRFSQLATAAREQNAGLWGACGGTDTPT